MSRIGPRILPLALLIVIPALVLAFFSWRSVGQEREARRAEVFDLTKAGSRAALAELEGELDRRRQVAWGTAGATASDLTRAGERGRLVAVLMRTGRFHYPRPPVSYAATLEERLRREDPSLLDRYTLATSAEFEKNRAAEASAAYLSLAALVDNPGTLAALLHAAARAAHRGGDLETVRMIGKRLAEEFYSATGESGMPYGVLIGVRLLELDPSAEALQALTRAFAAGSLPGHSREMILRDLEGRTGLSAGEALADARALEEIEEALGHPEGRSDDAVLIDGHPYLLTYRTIEDGDAAIAVPLGAFPSSPGILGEFEGISYGIAGWNASGGEELGREGSEEFPSFAVTALLLDPSRLEVPVGRLWLTGGLIACLVAALLVGLFGLFRGVSKELALARMKGEFVSGVSHDLKTPLTSIRMFAEMLEGGKVHSEEKKKEYLGVIHRQSIRLSRMVENVLDFSRIEEGRKTYTLAVRSLTDVVREAAGVFRTQVEGQDVRFNVDLPPEPILVKLDADALSSAILNLLDNALKYGGDPKDIGLAVIRRGDHGEIIVSDENGPGIPSAERERIFERFVRGAEAAAGPSGGAGLGLWLVRHVAGAHGGSAGVQSDPENGSRFILSLPICQESLS